MKALFYQIFSVLASRGLLKIVNSLVIVLLARSLSVDDYGFYGLFVTTVGVVILLTSLGVRHAGAYVIGQGIMDAGAVSGAILLLFVPLAIASSAAAWLLSAGSFPGPMIGWLPAMALGASAFLLFTVQQGVFLGRGKIFWFNACEVTPKLLLLLLTGASLLVGFMTLEAAIYYYGIAYAVVTAAFFAWNCWTLENPLRFDVRRTLDLVRRGLPFGFAVFLIMLNNRISLFVLTEVSDPTELGHFFVSLQMTDILNEIASSVGLVLFAHGARSKDPQVALRQAARVTSVLVWISAAAAIATWLVAPILVPLVLGAAYGEAVPVLQVLMFSLPLAGLAKVLYPALASLGFPRIGTAVLLPMAVVHLGVSWVLTAEYGAVGAAIALGAVQAAVAAIYLVVIWRRFNVSPVAFLVPSLRRDQLPSRRKTAS